MNRYDFPKVQLHCHLDGGIEPATLFELAKQNGVALPGNASTVEELTPYVVYDSSCVTVNKYLEKFELPTTILQNHAALERTAYELVLRLRKEGHIYADIRFAPQLHTRTGMTQAEAIEAVRAGIDRGLAATDGFMKVGLVACCMSFGTADLNHDANIETANLCVEYHKKGIVQAMDLAGAEGLCPLMDFADLFEIANAGGCPITCHAGDSHPASEIRTAMEVFHSPRIGHGHHLVFDKQLCEEAIEMKTTLEICPTSNVQCFTVPSYEEHPIRKLYDMGVRVTVSTDNTVIAGVGIEDEYDYLMEKQGFTYNELVMMNVYAAEAAFLPEEEKKEIVDTIKSYLK